MSKHGFLGTFDHVSKRYGSLRILCSGAYFGFWLSSSADIISDSNRKGLHTQVNKFFREVVADIIIGMPSTIPIPKKFKEKEPLTEIDVLIVPHVE